MTLFDIDGLRDTLNSLIDIGLKHDNTLAVGMMVQIELHQRDYVSLI
jgi:hypothetical protein